jgi:lipid II:glycine glycyltransferase (peptidoglycan interpeptide bridge formation enzyme)
MPIVSLSDWNQFISRHPNTHLLQTGEWGELKSVFGWKPVRVISGNVGVQILFRKLPLGFTVGYIPKAVIPKGDAVSEQSSVNSGRFWKEVDSVCKSHHTIFLKLEPDSWDSSFIIHHSHQHLRLVQVSFIISPHNIQPPRTIMIDIRGSEEEILAKMKQKTRYNIRLAEKKGVTVRVWDDVESFHKMMLVTGGRDGFGVHSLEYYKRAYELLQPKGLGEILVAEFENKPLAALFVARNGNRAYYLYGASTDEERNRMPTYLLQWEAMKWAKARGCEEYDLWGVPDEDEATLEANFESRHDGLWGVYRFKRGFGGELKRAAQAMDRVYNPLLYWVYLKFIGSRE